MLAFYKTTRVPSTLVLYKKNQTHFEKTVGNPKGLIMVENAKLQFRHWVNLQKCLKYDTLRLDYGEAKLDDADKHSLLEKLQKAQVEYYQHQLHIRELVGKVRMNTEVQSQSHG